MLCVVLVIAALSVVGTTYIQHVETVRRDREVAVNAMGGRKAVESGAEIAKQSLQLQRDMADTEITAGTDTVAIQAQDLADGRSRVLLQAVQRDGIGATLLAETQWVPSGQGSVPDDLPRVDATVMADLLADVNVTKHWVSGQTTWSDTTVEGLVIVQNSSALVLDDVVIKGAIVSEDSTFASSLGDYDMSTTPTVLISGDVRIDSDASVLEGVGLCMPDGTVMSYADQGRVQVDGDVIAHTLRVLCPGTILGNVASVEDVDFHDDFERPGHGRVPQAWSDILDTDAVHQDVGFMAFVPRRPTMGALETITQAELPEPTVKKVDGGSSASQLEEK